METNFYIAYLTTDHEQIRFFYSSSFNRRLRKSRKRKWWATGTAEINFERLIWDKVNTRYYRFSYQADVETVERDGWFSLSAKNVQVYLTVFDKNLEMITEAIVPQLTTIPQTYFVKDGSIWIFENMEDELGFVRLSIDLWFRNLGAIFF